MLITYCSLLFGLYIFAVLLSKELLYFTTAEENITGVYDNLTFSHASDWYTIISFENETGDAFSSTAMPLKIEAMLSYPKIASERRQMMNWDDKALDRRFHQSAGNKSLFLTILREEFRKTTTNSKKQQNQDWTLKMKPRVYLKRKGRILYARPAFIYETSLRDLLNALNKARTDVEPTADEMYKLSWDYNLETSAWEVAQSCRFENRESYEKPTSYGENLWMGWGFSRDRFTPLKAVSAWLSEKRYFDPRLRMCLGGPCEFYVQMIWHSMYKVGCSWNFCAGARLYGVGITNATFVVCHFGPGSISLPFLAYYAGHPCSFCPPNDECTMNLCSNSEREVITDLKPPTGIILLSEEAKITLIVALSLFGAVIVVFLVSFAITNSSQVGSSVKITAKVQETLANLRGRVSDDSEKTSSETSGDSDTTSTETSGNPDTTSSEYSTNSTENSYSSNYSNTYEVIDSTYLN